VGSFAPVHVGLNLVFLVPGETGGRETYARELIRALLRGHDDLRLTAFVNREAADAGASRWEDGVETVTVPVRARSRAQWAFGEHALLPRLAARAGVEVLHSMANTGPARGAYARVVTVHDLLYRRFPEFHSRAALAGTAVAMTAAIRRADRVIAISNATRAELVELMSTPAAKIDVVPNGVAVPGQAAATDPDAVRDRYELGRRPLVLTLAARLRHKNLQSIVEAAALIPAAERPLFAIAGQSTSLDAEIAARAVALGVSEDVRLLAWIPAPDVEGLYAAASCMAFPSLYEGFGLPVLEAMARGVPVACSDIPPLREVADGAAVYFDPRSPPELAAAVSGLLRDTADADSRRAAGLERARGFSWDATARLTVASYRRALADWQSS
jgi:glycosyltransferase involved in cell wall biosynthesis